MRDADHTAGLPPQPDPPQDRPAKPVPPNIADLLVIVRILLGYGRHLANTLERRAAGRGFATIAQFFGTARLPAIQARLARGLLRAMALEQVLLARAARGRDLVFYTRRDPDDRPPQPAHAQPAQQAAAPPPPRPARRPAPDEPPDPANLPTLEQLTAYIRRRPVGHAIADICRDLGVAPTLCDGILWNALYEAITWYRGSFLRYYRDMRKRRRSPTRTNGTATQPTPSTGRSRPATASAAPSASSSASPGPRRSHRPPWRRPPPRGRPDRTPAPPARLTPRDRPPAGPATRIRAVRSGGVKPPAQSPPAPRQGCPATGLPSLFTPNPPI